MKTFVKACFVSVVVIASVFGCIAQEKLRRIEQPPRFVYPNTPIKVQFSSEGKPMPDREVRDASDWLKRISLEVTNISGKDVRAMQIDLMFTEPKAGASVITITVELAYSEPRIKVLSAGQRVTLKPPDRVVDHWMKFAQERGMEDIETVFLDIRQIAFTDDTAWFRGHSSRKDPETGQHVFVTPNREPEIVPSLR